MVSCFDQILRYAITAVKWSRSIREMVADYGKPLTRHSRENYITYGKGREICGLSTSYVRILACKLSEMMWIANPFNKITGMSSRDWLSRFMKRCPVL